MRTSTLKAFKLQTTDLAECERFFGGVFGFVVTHRYSAGIFEEIVMTLDGGDGTMLKFIQFQENPALATGATIQIRLSDVDAAMAKAVAAHATVKMPPVDFSDAGVRMAIITTNQNLDIELVQEL